MQPNYGPFKFSQPNRDTLMLVCLSGIIYPFCSYTAERANSAAHNITSKGLRMALSEWLSKKLLTFFQARYQWDHPPELPYQVRRRVHGPHGARAFVRSLALLFHVQESLPTVSAQQGHLTFLVCFKLLDSKNTYIYELLCKINS